MRSATVIMVVASVAAGTACESPEAPDPWAIRDLEPEPNPFGPDDPLWAPQPHRDRPRAAMLSGDGRTLWVALAGAEDVPSHEVAAVDLATRKVRRIAVGRAPVALALHPSGRFLVVANLLSNRASVIDTTNDRVVIAYPIPWYTTAIAFSPDGRHAYFANRWKDAVLRWDVDVGDRFVVTDDNYTALAPWQPMGQPVAVNPDVLAVGEDGRVWIGAVAGEAIDVLDADAMPLGRIDVRSPIGGLLLAGRWLVASHIGRGVGFPPDDGVDGDENGTPGDGTGNVMFQDLQNELEVWDTETLASVDSITSDSLCCHDYRDVDPDRPDRGLLIPAPETWPPAWAAALPPRDRWIVGGALPTRMTALGPPTDDRQRFVVVMSASNQAQRFDLDLASGRLSAPDSAALYATGHAPIDVVATADGATAYVVDRLGEDVTVLPTDASPAADAPRNRLVVGDVGDGEFPASDVELGELFNNVTAPLTVDGDQSCIHCHRDGGNLDRVVAMPLQTDRLWGSRQVQAYRGAFDTRPWFLEAAMDEKNFFPVLNEFDRKENFCCEQLDPVIWPKYPNVNTCLATPSTPGCDAVLNCEATPPPECAARPYGAPYPTRNKFLLAAVERLTGRQTTFGDSLVLAGTRDPIALDFDGVTRAIGLFLLASPRLPPNPNRVLQLSAAARGRQLYEHPAVGCATCHPLPITTIASEPAFSPFGIPVRLPPVITPSLNPAGTICDTVTDGFRGTFQTGGLGPTEQGPEGIHFGIPQLRGLWDRAPRFFHDGRAHTLESALLPPGHPALEGAAGFNERYGMPDTHGGTSQLSRDDVDDLLAFVLTL
jgi:mono/diheme cytochrome c family protein